MHPLQPNNNKSNSLFIMHRPPKSIGLLFVTLLGVWIMFLVGVYIGQISADDSTLTSRQLLHEQLPQQLPQETTTTTTATASPPETTTAEVIPHHPSKWISSSVSREALYPTVDHVRPDQLKLPTPVMVMGMMKAGTTSIESYFRCGFGPKYQHKVSHYDCNPGPNPKRVRLACGKRLRANIENWHKPPFDKIDHFEVYAELDGQENWGGMTLPQVTFLKEIHDVYPNSTWILNLRDAHSWLRSVDKWSDLRQRFIQNRYHLPFHKTYPWFPKEAGKTDQEMIDFYYAQAEQVREFVRQYPSHTLVEVSIDDDNAGDIMEEAFGIPKICWGNHNVNDRVKKFSEAS